MADILDQLADELGPIDASPSAGASGPVSWGDYGQALKSGSYGVAGSIAGMGQYLTGGDEDSILAGIRRWGKQGAQSAIQGMTPAGQKAIQAKVLPGAGPSMWDSDVPTRSAVGLKVTATLPSLVASIVPGGVVARAAMMAGGSIGSASALGTLAGGAAGGAMSGGDVFNDIQQSILDSTPEQLAKESSLYRGLRDLGLDDTAAKKHLIEESTRYQPAIMAGITALTSKYGIEGMTARKLAGEGIAGKLRQRMLSGAAGEGAQEFVENASQSLLTQQGKNATQDKPLSIDWHDVWNDALEGALVGAITGGATGAALKHNEHEAKPSSTVNVSDVDPAEAAAVAADQPQPSAPPAPTPAAPTTPEEDLAKAGAGLDQLGEQITQIENGGTPKAEAAKEVSRKRTRTKRQGRKTVEVVPEGEVSSDQAAALAADQVEQAPAPAPTPAPEPAPEPAVAAPGPAETPPTPIQPTPATQPAPTANVGANAELMAGINPEDITEPENLEYDADHELPVAPAPQAVAQVQQVPEQDNPAPQPAVTQQVTEPQPAAVEASKPEVPRVEEPKAEPPAPEAPKVEAQKQPRVLPDLAQERRARKGERMTAAKRAQVEAGETEILTKENHEKRVKERNKQALVNRVRKFFEDSKYNPAEMNTPEKQRAYIWSMLEAANIPADIKLSRLEADADPVLMHLAKAQKLGRNRGTKSDLVDFMVDDMDQRARAEGDASGTALTAEFRKSQAAKSEQSADASGDKPALMPVDDSSPSEDDILDQIDAKRHEEAKAEVQKATVAPDAVTAGKDKAGTFRAEVVRNGRRKLDVPGAPKVTGKITLSGKPKVEPRSAPTEAQKEAGNYPKDHVTVGGLGITIENRKGSERSGKGPDGKPWSVTMPAHYGYIKRSEGADGDHVDVYLGPRALPGTNLIARDPVFIVNQQDPDHKPPTRNDFKDFTWDPPPAEPGYVYHATSVDNALDISQDALHPHAPDFGTEQSAWPDGGTEDRSYWTASPASAASFVPEGAPALLRTKRTARFRNERGTGDVVTRAALPASDLEYLGKDGRWHSLSGFDEHKVLLGFTSRDQAIETYVKGFSDGRGAERIQSVSEMTFDGFKEWLAKGKQERPATLEPELAREARVHASIGVDANQDADYGPVFEELVRLLHKLERKTPKPATIAKRKGTVAEFLDEYVPNFQGADRVVGRFFAEKIKKLAGNVPVYVVDREGMLQLYAKELESGKLNDLPWGSYSQATDDIVLREDILHGDPVQASRLVLHEALHTAYANAIDDDTNSDVVADLLAELDGAAYEQMAREQKAGTLPADFNPYGFTDLHEFVSEAFTNPSFQALLARTPFKGKYDSSLRNAWVWFVWSVRKALGLSMVKHSVLEGVIRVVDRLDERMAGQRPEFDPSAAHYSHASIGRDDITDRAKGLAHDIRRWGYKVATLDQLRQIGKGRFTKGDTDLLDQVVSSIQRITPLANQIRERGEKLAQRFIELRQKNEAEAREFAELGVDATMLNVNLGTGSNTHLGKDNAQGWQAKAHLPTLQERYGTMSQEARALWQDMATYYRDTQNGITRALVSNILDTLEVPLAPAKRVEITDKVLAGTLNDADKKALGNNTVFRALNDAREVRAIKGVYFPLMRHGTYVVRTTDNVDTMGGKEIEPGVVEFRAPDDKTARAAAKAFAEKTPLKINSIKKAYFLRSNGKQLSAVNAVGQDVDIAYRVRVQKEGVHFFDTPSEAMAFQREAKGQFAQVSEVLDKKDMETRGDLSTSQLASLMASINARDSVPEGTKAMMRTAFGQAAARLMSGNRVQQRSITRRHLAGASRDFARNTLTYAEATSRYLGKLKYMPDVRQALADMRETLSGTRIYDKEAPLRNQLLNEVEKRVNENVVSPRESPQWVQDIKTLSFLDKLASPTYSVLNGLQVSMVTYPVLAGRHGQAQTALHLTRVYNDIGAGRVTLGGISNTYQAIRHFRNVGLDTSDLAGSIRANLAKASDGKALVKLLDTLVERGAMDAGAGFEIAASVTTGRGRWGTGLAKMDRVARQLPFAVEQINRATTAVAAYRLGKLQGMSDEQASSHAFDTVMNTQGDYGAHNAPAMFNHPLWSVSLQFKKYAQLMSYLMYDMTRKALKGATPEEKKIARKQLATLAAVQVAMAGSLGLPGIELVKIASMAVGLATGGGGWDDVEKWLRGIHDRALGKTWGELVSRGVLSRAVGIDLSSRVSLADLWTFGEPKSGDTRDVKAYFADLAMGAPGSLIVDWYDARGHMIDGDWMKAAEKIVPAKVIADAIKGQRLYNEGKVSRLEQGLQTFGARSARMAEEGERIGRTIKSREDLNKRSKELKRAYIAARNAGERAKLVAKIREFNSTPGLGLKQKVFIGALDKVRAQNDRKRVELQGAD